MQINWDRLLLPVGFTDDINHVPYDNYSQHFIHKFKNLSHQYVVKPLTNKFSKVVESQSLKFNMKLIV